MFIDKCHQLPLYLATYGRGPGSVLGDDCVRERRMGVSVQAITPVVTLRVPPQKLLTYLDPLTLRLLNRLRAQYVAGYQLQQVTTALVCRDGCHQE